MPPHSNGDPQLVGDGAGHLYDRPDSSHVDRVDLASGAVKLVLTMPVSEVPTGMAWGFGSLWVTNFDGDIIRRVDPDA